MIEIPISIAAFVLLTVSTTAMAAVYHIKTVKNKHKALLANNVVVEIDPNGVEKYRISDAKGLSEGEDNLNKLLYKQLKVEAKKSKIEAKKSKEETKKMQNDLDTSNEELKELKSKFKKEIKKSKESKESKAVSLDSYSDSKVSQDTPLGRKAVTNKKDYLKVPNKSTKKDEIKHKMAVKTKVDLYTDGDSSEASGSGGAKSTSDNSEVSHIGDAAASASASEG